MPNYKNTPTRPVWLRVTDAIKRFGIGRTKLYELIESGSIKTALIKEEGRHRGKRLINYDSLNSYIESHVEDLND